MDEFCDRNPSKSEGIGGCGGDEKTQMTKQTRQNVHVYTMIVPSIISYSI